MLTIVVERLTIVVSWPRVDSALCGKRRVLLLARNVLLKARMNQEPSRIRLCLVLCGVFAWGCGGEPGVVLVGSDDVGPRSRSDSLEGQTMYLRRRSSSCGSTASNPLIAEVGDGIEFPSTATARLELPCELAQSPRVEISVEGRSVIFDFSKVEAAGAFPEGKFDGYELSFERSCGDVVVEAVSLDTTLSGTTAEKVGISHHYDRIEVDFQGLTYDQGSFVKIDFDLADVICFSERSGLVTQ